MSAALRRQVHELALKLNDNDSKVRVSVLAISESLCELEVSIRRSPKTVVVRDNMNYSAALFFLRGFSYGRHLPS